MKTLGDSEIIDILTAGSWVTAGKGGQIRLEGKVCLVTGGATGIGETSALALVREGVRDPQGDYTSHRPTRLPAGCSIGGRLPGQDDTEFATGAPFFMEEV